MENDYVNKTKIRKLIKATAKKRKLRTSVPAIDDLVSYLDGIIEPLIIDITEESVRRAKGKGKKTILEDHMTGARNALNLNWNSPTEIEK